MLRSFQFINKLNHGFMHAFFMFPRLHGPNQTFVDEFQNVLI